MKKSLVLAMAMALGVSASAFAANPFSDVPAGHWAYDAVNKLAAAGIVNGYQDGTFKGQKLMTRYEMAKIVATAMAKGANVDRLASEFADELDSLGVRVANLEKKSDNVKITGEIRYNYKSEKYKDAGKRVPADLNSKGGNYETGLRSRLWFEGQANDDWKYVAMIENTQDFADDKGNEDTEFKRAYVEGKLGGIGISAGRQDFVLVDGNLFDGQYDGINASYGDKIKLSGFYGKPSNDDVYGEYGYTKFWGADLAAALGAVDLSAGYTKFQDSDTNAANKIWNAGLNFNLGDVATLGAVYLNSDKAGDGKNDGIVATLGIKGAEASEPGSYGLVAKYYNQEKNTSVAHTMDGHYFYEGTKGYSVGANYAFAQNIVGAVTYYDTEAKDTDEKAKVIWSELTFTF